MISYENGEANNQTRKKAKRRRDQRNEPPWDKQLVKTTKILHDELEQSYSKSVEYSPF